MEVKGEEAESFQNEITIRRTPRTTSETHCSGLSFGGDDISRLSNMYKVSEIAVEMRSSEIVASQELRNRFHPGSDNFS